MPAIAAGDVPVIVVLMHGRDDLRGVDDRHALPLGMVDEPVVVHGPADGKRRDFRQERLAVDEVVFADARRRRTARVGMPQQRGMPIRVGKFERRVDVRIGPATDHKKRSLDAGRRTAYGSTEIVAKDDVGVDVSEHFVRGP